MAAHLENYAVATGLQKVIFHSSLKEGQGQRMFKLPQNCTHFTSGKVILKILQAVSTVCEPRTSTCTSWVLKRHGKPEVKLSPFIGSCRQQESSRKTSTSASLTMLKPLTVWITTNWWKFLKRCEYPTPVPVLRNLFVAQEAAVRTGHEMTDWLIIGKGTQEDSILSPCLFNFYAEYVMQNCWLDESQAEIKTARRNINNLRYADNTTLTQKVKRN